VSRRGWLLFLTMGIIWGLPYPLIKIAVGYLTPASLVFVRTTFAAALLVPIAAVRGELRPLLRSWRPLLAYTGFELAAPWFLLSHAEQRLSSSLAGLLLASIPMVGAVVGVVTRTERMDWRRAAGLAIGIAGVASLVGLDLGRGDVGALLEMALVALGYAIGPFILVRRLRDQPGLGVVAASLIITAAVYAVPAAFQLPRHWPPLPAVGAVAVLSVVCTAVAFLLLFALIDEIGPGRATVITYINPAVAVTIGVVFLGEPFTRGIAIGFVLVLLGSALATRRARPSTEDVGAEDVGSEEVVPEEVAPA
jgi:drug/metabolite transporter (DMT)-like permease